MYLALCALPRSPRGLGRGALARGLGAPPGRAPPGALRRPGGGPDARAAGRRRGVPVSSPSGGNPGAAGAVGLLAAASLVRETSLIGGGALALVRWRQGDGGKPSERRHAGGRRPRVAGLGGCSRPVVQGVGVPRPRRALVLASREARAALDARPIAETARSARWSGRGRPAPLLPRWRSWSPAAWTYAGFVLLCDGREPDLRRPLGVRAGHLALPCSPYRSPARGPAEVARLLRAVPSPTRPRGRHDPSHDAPPGVARGLIVP